MYEDRKKDIFCRSTKVAIIQDEKTTFKAKTVEGEDVAKNGHFVQIQFPVKSFDLELETKMLVSDGQTVAHDGKRFNSKTSRWTTWCLSQMVAKKKMCNCVQENS